MSSCCSRMYLTALFISLCFVFSREEANDRKEDALVESSLYGRLGLQESFFDNDAFQRPQSKIQFSPKNHVNRDSARVIDDLDRRIRAKSMDLKKEQIRTKTMNVKMKQQFEGATERIQTPKRHRRDLRNRRRRELMENIMKELRSPLSPENTWVAVHNLPAVEQILNNLLTSKEPIQGKLVNVTNVLMNQMNDMTLFKIEFQYIPEGIETPVKCQVAFNVFMGVLNPINTDCEDSAFPRFVEQKVGDWVSRDPDDPQWILPVNMALKQIHVNRDVRSVMDVLTKSVSPQKTNVRATFTIFHNKVEIICSLEYTESGGPFYLIETNWVKCDDDEKKKFPNNTNQNLRKAIIADFGDG